jgi:Holliday junction resolvasome RuvABC DNA-binding subunit
VGRDFAGDARLALETLGYPKPIARAAVESALSRPDIASLEALIREALRACPLRAA